MSAIKFVPGLNPIWESIMYVEEVETEYEAIVTAFKLRCCSVKESYSKDLLPLFVCPCDAVIFEWHRRTGVIDAEGVRVVKIKEYLRDFKKYCMQVAEWYKATSDVFEVVAASLICGCDCELQASLDCMLKMSMCSLVRTLLDMQWIPQLKDLLEGDDGYDITVDYEEDTKQIIFTGITDESEEMSDFDKEKAEVKVSAGCSDCYVSFNKLQGCYVNKRRDKQTIGTEVGEAKRPCALDIQYEAPATLTPYKHRLLPPMPPGIRRTANQAGGVKMEAP